MAVNFKAKKIDITVTHPDGRIEESIRPLLVDFLIYEAANKKHKEIIVDDFIQLSKIYLKFLELIVKDCHQRFTQPKRNSS
jgi:hypothetical protein